MVGLTYPRSSRGFSLKPSLASLPDVQAGNPAARMVRISALVNSRSRVVLGNALSTEIRGYRLRSRSPVARGTEYNPVSRLSHSSRSVAPRLSVGNLVGQVLRNGTKERTLINQQISTYSDLTL